jgi:hypothetical protein
VWNGGGGARGCSWRLRARVVRRRVIDGEAGRPAVMGFDSFSYRRGRRRGDDLMRGK